MAPLMLGSSTSTMKERGMPVLFFNLRAGSAFLSCGQTRHVRDASPPGSQWERAGHRKPSSPPLSYSSGTIPDVMAGVSAAVAGVVGGKAGGRLGAVATRRTTRKKERERKEMNRQP